LENTQLSSRSQESGIPISVLYIDNNSSDRDLVRESLDEKHSGFKITEAATREELEALLEQGKYDVVLTDFDIFGFEGLQVLDAVRAKAPTVPVIIVTGKGSEGVAVEAIKRGAADYVIKTENQIKRLPHAIRMVIEKQRIEERYKFAEKALRQKESLSQSAFDAVQDGISVLDRDLNILQVNAWTKRMYSNQMPLVGKKCYEVYQQRQSPCSWCPSIPTIDTGEVHSEIVPYPSAEKPTGWIELFAYPGKDAYGNVVSVIEYVKDITLRKRTEDALRESEEMFRAISASAKDAIIMMDNEGNVSYWNKAAKNMFGYKSEEIIGKNLHHTLAPQEYHKAYETGHTLFKDRGQGRVVEKTIELKGIKKDGREFPIELSLSSVKRRGEWYAIAIIRDITDRKRAEEELKQYRFMVEFAYDAIFFKDLESRYVIANDRTLEVFGLSREEVIGKNDFDIMADKEGAKKNVEDDRKVFSTGKPKEIILHMTGVDGKEYWFQTIKSPHLDVAGNITGLIGIARDITGRRQAEEALRKNEEKYRALLENTDNVYFETDLAGNVTFVNSALCKTMEYSRNELLGMNNREYTTPETAKRMYRVFNEIYRTENPARVEEYEVFTKDGSKRIMEMSAFLMRDPEGKPIGFCGLGRDVTRRKEAEEEKKKLEDHLYKAKKMEAIGTLAGGIAHDFNNLLMGIQGNISLALLDMDSSHSHYQKLVNVEEYVRSGAELTRQLMGFAQVGQYEVKPIDLNKLVRKSSAMFGRTRKEIKIHRKYRKNIWAVEADQGQIGQVLLNLYVNAWQAMPEGGDLYIQTENVTLDEACVKPYDIEPGNYVKISVTDTGAGMNKDTKEKIFDPFFTTKEMGRGTGLGLASAYGIIKNHGGVINVYSEKGAGAAFNIYLPASEAVISDRGAVVGEERLLTGHETILLVDDEDMIIDISEEVLRILGYKVLPARSGKEAIEIYIENQNDIDMVMLDMVMPGMSGGETYDNLKEINPEIKVLLSSGYSLNGQARAIIKRGCDNFIQKPFTVKDISRKIREILDQKEQS